MKIKRILFCIAITLIVTLFANSVAFTGNKDPKRHRVTIRTLVKGAPIHGTNGLYFGPDGNLYIASVGGNEIIKMDPNSGRFLDRIGMERGVFTPDDLTFGPDGSLYWTSIVTGVVGSLSPSGEYKTVASLGPGVNAITFSPDNQWIYVALDFLGKGLYKVKADGTAVIPLLPDLVNLNGFDFGPDGWLYGPIYGEKVVKVNVNADPPVLEDLITGIAPSAVKFDLHGQLYTNDNNTGEVLRYNIWTKKTEVLATLPFTNMDNLAIDSRGQVYVSGAWDGYIVKIQPISRNYERCDHHRSTNNYVLLSPGGMIYPSGVAVLPRVRNPHALHYGWPPYADGGESVYVGDLWSLREFDGLTGKSLGDEFANVISGGLTQKPFSVAPDGDNLIISSSFNGVVQIYDPVNHEVLDTYQDTIFPGVPFYPVNVIRYQGDLVATDLATGLIVRRISGVWIPIFQDPGFSPVGLATNGSNLWVTDYLQGSVYEIGSATPIASGLVGPEGIAYYPPDGSLLVVEADAGRLTKINPATGNKTTLAEGLEFGNHWLFPYLPTSDGMIDGVAVGPSGTIYVTGNKANVLYQIEIH